MMMTPIDYWRAGMEVWLKTAEAQLDMSYKLMAAMPGFDIALASVRGLRDDSVTLKATGERPALQKAPPTSAKASASSGSQTRKTAGKGAKSGTKASRAAASETQAPAEPTSPAPVNPAAANQPAAPAATSQPAAQPARKTQTGE